MLSGATDGQLITVTGTTATGGALGTVVHTAASGTGTIDEIWLYAWNTATQGAGELVLRYGGSGAALGSEVRATIPKQDGPYLVVPGFPMNNARTIRAFAAVASKYYVLGYVHRITTG
jgi:hypothetical protein